jgi:rhodanese-related sulfurtransferase
MRHFTPTQLKEYLQQAELPPLLLDVREPWEFQICAIEGSSLVPMGQIPAKVETLDPKQETVIICHHGIRSRQTGYYLERMGFSNLINLDGGVEAWAREVDPDMQTY